MIKLKAFLHRWAAASREALACLGESLRDVRHGGLWWRSALLSVAATCLWLAIYYAYPGDFMRFSGYVAFFSFLGLLSAFGPAFPAAGSSSVVGMANIGPALIQSIGPMLQVVQLAVIALAIAAVLHVLIFIFLVHATVSLSSRRLLLDRVRGVAARRYPGQPAATPPQPDRLSGWARVWHGVKFLLWLCVPIVPLLYLLRFLFTWNLRWIDHGIPHRAPMPAEQVRATLVFGVLLALVMLIPFLNLLVPSMLCSGVCHLRSRAARA